jgi:hypothetical protein
VTSYSLVKTFGGTYCLNLQDISVNLCQSERRRFPQGWLSSRAVLVTQNCRRYDCWGGMICEKRPSYDTNAASWWMIEA